MWPFKPNVGREIAQKLQLDVPEAFLNEHRPLFEAVAAAIEHGKPVRVLEYGAGEAAGAQARHFSSMCAAVAEKTRGGLVAVSFSDEAVRRTGLRSAGSVQLVDGNAADTKSLGTEPFDLVVHHPVAARTQTHPLHTFWSFIELEPAVADGALWVFPDAVSADGERCEYVRQYLEVMSIRPLAWGEECAWRYQRVYPEIPEVVRQKGSYARLPDEAKLDAASFLRLYDQAFAPLLRARAGTFRMMFETLLAKPGPYTIIETGTTRESGDIASNGQSTVLFDLIVNFFGGQVITIDIDPTNTRYCRTRTSEKTTLITSDSVRALRGLPEIAQADLVYLDSYDFDGTNPHPSSLHHLLELAAIWKRTRPNTLLVIDDCFGPEHGKHAYVSRFLQSVGVGPYFAGYQTGWLI